MARLPATVDVTCQLEMRGFKSISIRDFYTTGIFHIVTGFFLGILVVLKRRTLVGSTLEDVQVDPATQNSNTSYHRLYEIHGQEPVCADE